MKHNLSSKPIKRIINSDVAKPLSFVAIAIIGIFIGLFTPLKQYLTIDAIRGFAETLGAWGPITLLAIGALGPLMFLPRWPICFMGGMLYGVFWGALIGNIASLLGAWLHYTTAKSLVSDSSEKLLKRLNLDLGKLHGRNSFWTVFILRVVPISNSSATNLLAGALKISTKSYLAASFCGMIPTTIMYASWGKLMKKPSPECYVIAVGILALIIIATIVIRRFVSTKPSQTINTPLNSDS
jgi:uncharacterized membrane protein YdjX (TVP38/TMEM64 family)